MTYIPKPKMQHPSAARNKLGLTRRDYEGALSTLCAGCGHDSITAAIVQAFFDLSIAPHQVAKMSGIGCSSKTPGYFLAQAHGFNAVHGRMPSVTTGANAGHSSLTYIGVSGDGDTGSIGLGQFMHAMRRNINMLYIIENNGVYGLTKGQFSALADFNARNKKGDTNLFNGLDPVTLAIQAGAGFVARSFSGDKQQLIPLIKGGLMHHGFALIDVVSPCVTFNNHSGSTRSYDYARDFNEVANTIDFVPHREEITVAIDDGQEQLVELHDGSLLHIAKLKAGHPHDDGLKAIQSIEAQKSSGKILTGLLYLKAAKHPDHAAIMKLPPMPLRELGIEQLCPGQEVLDRINHRLS